MAQQFEPRICKELMHIVPASGVKIVDAQHVPTALEQPLAKMRAYEAGPTGHEHSTLRQHPSIPR
jgi:hypothetical protein